MLALPYILLLLSLCASLSTQAAGIASLYQNAIKTDATFNQALNTYRAAAEAVVQSKAATRPSLTLNAIAGKTHDKVNAGHFDVNSDYSYQRWQLSASQSLYNKQHSKELEKVSSEFKANELLFEAAAQTLMLRTAQSYFEAYLGNQELILAKSKTQTAKIYLKQAQARHKVKLVNKQQLMDAAQALKKARLQASYTQHRQDLRLEKLLTSSAIEPNTHLPPLPLTPPEPLQTWTQLALGSNKALLAQRLQSQAAQTQVAAQQAANWPRFSLDANTTQTGNYGGESSFLIPRRQNTSQVLLSMSLPIYQGGLYASKINQAKYQEKAQNYTQTQVKHQLLGQVKRTYHDLLDTLNQLSADRAEIKLMAHKLSREQALYPLHATTAYKLNLAKQACTQAELRHQTHQVKLLQTQLKLKYLAGTLNLQDLKAIDYWLTQTRAQAS